jgi:hypothetical protein
MTVTATGWSYSLNGAAATTGSFTFDTTKNYEVVGFIQGNNSDPDNVDGAYFSNITLTTIPEPATLGLVGTFGIAIMFIRRLRV